MLSVNGRNLECRGTRVDRRSVRSTKGGSQAKSCDDVCPRVVCERSPAMMFDQGWFANKVLQWCLPKDGLQAKSYDDVWSKVVRKQSPAMMIVQGWLARWLRDNCATILNQDKQIRARTDTMAVWGTAKGELRRGNCEEGTAKGELRKGNCKGGTAKGRECDDNKWE